MDKYSNFKLIVERIKRQFLFKSDKEFAKAIGMSATAFHNRKKTASLPYQEIVEFSNSRNVNLNWALTGDGPVFKEEKTVFYEKDSDQSNSSNITKVIIEHQDIVKRFKDPEKGLINNKRMIELEQVSPAVYDKFTEDLEKAHEIAMIMNKEKKVSQKKTSSTKKLKGNGE